MHFRVEEIMPITMSANSTPKKDWAKHTVAELREELTARGLTTSGVKKVLIRKIEEHDGVTEQEDNDMHKDIEGEENQDVVTEENIQQDGNEDQEQESAEQVASEEEEQDGVSPEQTEGQEELEAVKQEQVEQETEEEAVGTEQIENGEEQHPQEEGEGIKQEYMGEMEGNVDIVKQEQEEEMKQGDAEDAHENGDVKVEESGEHDEGMEVDNENETSNLSDDVRDLKVLDEYVADDDLDKSESKLVIDAGDTDKKESSEDQEIKKAKEKAMKMEIVSFDQFKKTLNREQRNAYRKSTLFVHPLSVEAALGEAIVEWARNAAYFCISYDKQGYGVAIMTYTRYKDCEAAKEAMTEALGSEVVHYLNDEIERKIYNTQFYTVHSPNVSSDTSTIVLEAASPDMKEEDVFTLFPGAILVYRPNIERKEDVALPEYVYTTYVVVFTNQNGATQALEENNKKPDDEKLALQTMTKYLTDYEVWAGNRKKEKDQFLKEAKLARAKEQVFDDNERLEMCKAAKRLDDKQQDLKRNKDMSASSREKELDKIAGQLRDILRAIDEDTTLRLDTGLPLPEPFSMMTTNTRRKFAQSMDKKKQELRDKVDKQKGQVPRKETKTERRKRERARQAERQLEEKRRREDWERRDKERREAKKHDKNEQRDKKEAGEKKEDHRDRKEAQKKEEPQTDKKDEKSGENKTASSRDGSSDSKNSKKDDKDKQGDEPKAKEPSLKEEMAKVAPDAKGWYTVCVKKIMKGMEEKTVRDTFQKFGTITEIVFTSKNIYIRFNNALSAKSAVLGVWRSKWEISVPGPREAGQKGKSEEDKDNEAQHIPTQTSRTAKVTKPDNKTTDSNASNNMYKRQLFIGNVTGKDFTAEKIKAHFQYYGVQHVQMQVKDLPSFHQIATVTFKTPEGARQALKLGWKQKLNDKSGFKIEIKLPKPTQTSKLRHTAHRMVIHDLPVRDKETTQQDIFFLLHEFYGQITYVEVPMNRRTNKNQGHAFVSFTSQGAMAEALNLAPYIGGRKVSMKVFTKGQTDGSGKTPPATPPSSQSMVPSPSMQPGVMGPPPGASVGPPMQPMMGPGPPMSGPMGPPMPGPMGPPMPGPMGPMGPGPQLMGPPGHGPQPMGPPMYGQPYMGPPGPVSPYMGPPGPVPSSMGPPGPVPSSMGPPGPGPMGLMGMQQPAPVQPVVQPAQPAIVTAVSAQQQPVSSTLPPPQVVLPQKLSSTQVVHATGTAKTYQCIHCKSSQSTLKAMLQHVTMCHGKEELAWISPDKGRECWHGVVPNEIFVSGGNISVENNRLKIEQGKGSQERDSRKRDSRSASDKSRHSRFDVPPEQIRRERSTSDRRRDYEEHEAKRPRMEEDQPPKDTAAVANVLKSITDVLSSKMAELTRIGDIATAGDAVAGIMDSIKSIQAPAANQKPADPYERQPVTQDTYDSSRQSTQYGSEANYPGPPPDTERRYSSSYESTAASYGSAYESPYDRRESGKYADQASSSYGKQSGYDPLPHASSAAKYGDSSSDPYGRYQGSDYAARRNEPQSSQVSSAYDQQQESRQGARRDETENHLLAQQKELLLQQQRQQALLQKELQELQQMRAQALRARKR